MNDLSEFILLAEHLMVGVAFITISIALMYYTLLEPDKVGDIWELERTIFTVVVAAVVITFFQIVHKSEPHINYAIIILSTGVGLAAVVIALGIFVKLTAKRS